ncbi:hypothetical protein EON83_26645 [bacterium]|nr:MAG: hypothetical protein EON83_26645 [bacterium]
MTVTQEIMLIRTSEAASTHEDWLSLMRVTMEALLREPRLLAELIWGEAARQAARHQCKYPTSSEALKIFDELGTPRH